MPRGPWGSGSRRAARFGRVDVSREEVSRSEPQSDGGGIGGSADVARGLGAVQTKHSTAGQVKPGRLPKWQRSAEGSDGDGGGTARGGRIGARAGRRRLVRPQRARGGVEHARALRLVGTLRGAGIAL